MLNRQDPIRISDLKQAVKRMICMHSDSKADLWEFSQSLNFDSDCFLSSSLQLFILQNVWDTFHYIVLGLGSLKPLPLQGSENSKSWHRVKQQFWDRSQGQ